VFAKGDWRKGLPSRVFSAEARAVSLWSFGSSSPPLPVRHSNTTRKHDTCKCVDLGRIGTRGVLAASVPRSRRVPRRRGCYCCCWARLRVACLVVGRHVPACAIVRLTSFVPIRSYACVVVCCCCLSLCACQWCRLNVGAMVLAPPARAAATTAVRTDHRTHTTTTTTTTGIEMQRTQRAACSVERSDSSCGVCCD
jgi:hypothetical protein